MTHTSTCRELAVQTTDPTGSTDLGGRRARVYLNDQLRADLERGRLLPAVLRVTGGRREGARLRSLVAGTSLVRGVLRLELELTEFLGGGTGTAELTTPLGMVEASGALLRLRGCTLSMKVEDVVARDVRSWEAPVGLAVEVRTEGGERSPARVVRVHDGSVWIEGVRGAERGDLLHLHARCGTRALLIPLEVKAHRDAQVRTEVLDGARLVGQHLSELRAMFEEVTRDQLWTPSWAGTRPGR